jgi:hypothetical protein
MKRITVHLTTDELEAVLWALTNFTNGDWKDAGSKELYDNLKKARIALIAGTKVSMAKNQHRELK